MSIDSVLDLVERLIESVDALISWRSLALVALIFLRKEIRQTIDRLTKRVKSVEIAGSKLDFSYSASRAITVSLEELAEDINTNDYDSQSVINAIKSIASKVPYLAENYSFSKKMKILWVDDNPENNRLETNLIKNMGAVVKPVKSTTEAIEIISSEDDFDLIISDIKRVENGKENHEAGYDFLDYIRRDYRYKNIPLIFYVGNVKWIKHGRVEEAQGSADNPDSLLKKVEEILRNNSGLFPK